MSLKKVEEGDTPRGTLIEMLAREEHLDGVIVIALNKDGTQFLSTSRMSGYEKGHLIMFALSWLIGRFQHEPGQSI